MNLDELVALLSEQPLLTLTIASILLAVLSGMVAARRPRLGAVMRSGAYLGLLAAGLLTVAQFAAHNTRSEAALWLDQQQEARVEGNKTIVPMYADGHFWVEARINGVAGDFLIDTGATYTGVSAQFAERAGLVPDPDDMGRMLDTANGTIVARMATASSVQFGSIEARGLQVAITPNTEVETNVIGMDLLSRLKGWSVEDGNLILVPRTQRDGAP